jgi:hypothetical protein
MKEQNMAIETDIAEGFTAKEILNSTVYLDAFEAIKQEILNIWSLSPSRDSEGREKLWMMLSMLNKVQATLQSTMESGQIAQVNLKHQQSMLDKAKEYIGL